MKTIVTKSSKNVLFKAVKMRKHVAIACVLLSTAAHAYDIDKKIIVTSGLEYDSNPSMSSTTKDPVWLFSIMPQIQAEIKNDLNRWYVDAGIKVLRYSNEKSETNQENPQILAGWDRAYESGTFGVKVGYQETTARNAELNNLGVFTNPDNTQKTKLVGANWQHRIAPRWTITTDGSYSDVTYSILRLGQLEDYTLAAIKSKLTYENSEQLTSYALVGYSRYDADSGKTNLFRAGLGADYQLSEGFTISPYLGVYNMSDRQSETDWEGALKGEYVANKYLINAAISRAVEDSGLGFRVVDSFLLNAEYSLTERDKVGAQYNFSQYKKDDAINASQLDTQSFGVSYTRYISEQWLAKAYITHKELDLTNSNPKGNVVGVTVVFNTLSF